MTKGSENPFPYITLVDTADPATPPAGQKYLWMDTDDTLKLKDEAGTVTPVSSAGGAVATDAIWDAAGDLAVGSGADTAAKLTKGAAGGALSIINATVAWNSGTSFPGSKLTGDRYWRTDLGMEFYYDGTRWVSTQLNHLTMALHNIAATTAYSAPSDSTGGSGYLKLPVPALSGGSDLWLVGITTQYLVAGGTALGASHKWVVVTSKRPTGNTNTTLTTLNVDSGSSSVWRTDTTAIGALLNNGTTHYVFDVTATKTGTPGPYFGLIDLTYRIVAT